MNKTKPTLPKEEATNLKARNPIASALKNHSGGGSVGAGAHKKSRGALRRAEQMAVAGALGKLKTGGNDDA